MGIMKNCQKVSMVLIWLFALIFFSACDDMASYVDQEDEQTLSATPSEGVSETDGNISISGSQAGDEQDDQTQDVTKKWVVYKNAESGFSIRYPEGYIIRENFSAFAAMKPQPVYEVGFFKDEDAVGVQPAILLVRIYSIPQEFDLASWLDVSDVLQRYGDSSTINSYDLENMTAFRVEAMQLMSPRWGVYAAHPIHALIFELVPGDNVGERMLTTFSVVEFR